VNCDLPVWATWTGVVVVLHRVEIVTFGFVYPVGDYSFDAAVYPFTGFPLDLACPQSTRDI
jgi:hypothetical protein